MTTHPPGVARRLLLSASVCLLAILAAAPDVTRAQAGTAALDPPPGPRVRSATADQSLRVRANTPTHLHDEPTPQDPTGEKRGPIAPLPPQAGGANPGTGSEANGAGAALPPRDPIESEPIRRGGTGTPVPLGLADGATDGANATRKRGTMGLLWKSLSGLAVVCGLMVVGVLVLKRVVPAAQRGGNSDAMAVLGRAYVGPKASLFLVRVGRRILVLGSTPAGISRVAEIVDPEEVEQVAARCQRSRAVSITNSFRHLLSQGIAGHRRTEQESGPDGQDAAARVAQAPSPAVFQQSGAAAPQESHVSDISEGCLPPGPPGTDDPADGTAEVGLIRQELDLILDKVRSWREGHAAGDRPADG